MTETMFMKTANLEARADSLRKTLESLSRRRIVERILAGDGTVWKGDAAAIAARLGWTNPLQGSSGLLSSIDEFVTDIRREGWTRSLLLGMGGSSLAAESFRRIFGVRKGFPNLEVLDTTAPETVHRAGRRNDPKTTLFLISSKSGTTIETKALFHHFYTKAVEALGPEEAGRHFAAITDPGTPLETAARNLGFRKIFHGRPSIGGRYSALSPFGLVPAALIGADPGRLLAKSEKIISSCRRADPGENPAAVLGTVLAVLAAEGINKATFLASSRIAPLTVWLEQLIAESTGKSGRGILPVPESAPGALRIYGRDRFFIHLRRGEKDALDAKAAALRREGFPMLTLTIGETATLPGHMFLWEMAVAVAGHLLGVNPFDQPNVESTKRSTKEVLNLWGEAKHELGKSPVKKREVPAISLENPAKDPAGIIEKLRVAASGKDYIAVLAFLDALPSTGRLLELLKNRLRDATGLPVTMGFGPRYLHSTGQLHKGDAGRGIFLQIISRSGKDIPISDVGGERRPAESFGTLFSAQAWGDWMALKESGRRVIRIDLGKNANSGIRRLLNPLLGNPRT